MLIARAQRYMESLLDEPLTFDQIAFDRRTKEGGCEVWPPVVLVALNTGDRLPTEIPKKSLTSTAKPLEPLVLNFCPRWSDPNGPSDIPPLHRPPGSATQIKGHLSEHLIERREQRRVQPRRDTYRDGVSRQDRAHLGSSDRG